MLFGRPQKINLNSRDSNISGAYNFVKNTLYFNINFKTSLLLTLRAPTKGEGSMPRGGTFRGGGTFGKKKE